MHALTPPSAEERSRSERVSKHEGGHQSRVHPRLASLNAQVGQARLACGTACVFGSSFETPRFARLLRFWQGSSDRSRFQRLRTTATVARNRSVRETFAT